MSEAEHSDSDHHLCNTCRHSGGGRCAARMTNDEVKRSSDGRRIVGCRSYVFDELADRVYQAARRRQIKGGFHGES